MLLCRRPEQIKTLLEQQENLHDRQSELKALLEHNESSRSHGGDEASVSVENWSGSFEWDSRAEDVRLNVFGISAYRANQREVGKTYLNMILRLLFSYRQLLWTFQHNLGYFSEESTCVVFCSFSLELQLIS